MEAVIPCPDTAVKCSVGSKLTFFSCAYATIASANGCSDGFSIEAATDNNSCSDIYSEGTMSVTFGFPSVMVPVLSNTTVFTL